MSDFKSESPTPRSSSSSSTTSVASTELKLYQAFIFSVPIFFTFILLFLFYLFYLRRRRVDWASLRMRANLDNNDIIRAELGLKKELREMLPIVVYKESFTVKDTQCPVCLADYQAEERLQQIPACGHTFHMECIDHWLSNHTTCPLCRLSLIPPAKMPSETPNNQAETPQECCTVVCTGATSGQSGEVFCGELVSRQLSEPHNEDFRTCNTAVAEDGRSECTAESERVEVTVDRHEPEEHERIPGVISKINRDTEQATP
ncbi:RING-H2 finger protein ATL7 isoform X2 [Euphorbia lathyris]|uniref:RING-H2 finger protein ATL7 isoform X2 n=1 Tax=Euphorbia lathyris TaxID=212925 RepID=UPI0033142378